MGLAQTYPIKVFCFGDKNGIINEVFPEEIASDDNYKHRMFKQKIKFKEKETNKIMEEKMEWNAILYPNLCDDNIDSLLPSLEINMNIPSEYEENLKKIDEDSRKRSNNIIIKFGKNNINYLINFLNSKTKTYLPQVAIITDENFDEVNEGLSDNRYLTIIKEGDKTDKELINDLKNYLWSKECYYNERGHILLKPLSSKNTDKIITNNFVNIMVTGISRAGKSTLINVLSGQLLTLESPFLESVTNIIREYEMNVSENDIFQTGIRFYDTPGLTENKKKKVNTIKMVKNAIEKKMKECNESKDNIHLIYFVLKPDSNLENYIDFFKYIIDMNNQRIKNGLKKISVIFIINRSTGKVAEDALREFLLSNNLYDLFEKIPILDENKVQLSYKERFAQRGTNSQNNDIKNNIISANILKSKICTNVFGINSLLKITLYFLKRDNPLIQEHFDKIEKIKRELDIIDCGGNNRPIKKKELENETNLAFNEISKQNSFLRGCNNINDVMKKAKYDSEKTSFYSAVFSKIFETKIPLNEYLSHF